MNIISNVPSCELYLKHIILEVFSKDFIDKNASETIYLDVSERDFGIEATTKFKDLISTNFQYFSDHNTPNITRTSAIGACIIDIGSALGFTPPPYGVLTGVRPIMVAAGIDPKYDFNRFTNELCKKYRASKDKCELLFDALKFDRSVRSNHTHTDVSLYFSIPFCPTRCNYCSFVSSSIEKKRHLIPEYLNAIYNEMNMVSNLLNKHSLSVKSVYVGGGTPGILDEQQIKAFFNEYNKCFKNHSPLEITFEIGRPETVTKEKLSILKQNNVSRISINTQSTNDDVLSAIGRKHSARDYFSAIKIAQEIGFDSINTDIIAGLEGESLDSFKNTLREVIDTGINNVTVHTLCLKKSSDIKKSQFDVKSRETIDEYINFSKNYCITSHFTPYYLYRQKYALGNHESVGYCKNGTYSHYNIAMMNEIETVIGLGAGATSRVILNGFEKHEHFENYKYPNEYIKDPLKTVSEISQIDKALSLIKK